MEHFELVEKLVNTFGVSYEKAKEALEASNWDAIDAAIYLEKAKKSEQQPVNQEIPEEPKQEAAPEEPKQEAPREEAKQEAAPEEPQPKVNTGTKGNSFNIPVDDIKDEGTKIFKTIWDFLSKNSFVVKKNSGEVFLDIPIWLTVLLFCAFFWPVVMIMAIVFLMGYRFGFSGPHLGRKKVRNAVDHVENATDEFFKKVKNAVGPDNCEPVENPEVQEEITIDPTPEAAAEPEQEAPKQEEPENAAQTDPGETTD